MELCFAVRDAVLEEKEGYGLCDMKAQLYQDAIWCLLYIVLKHWSNISYAVGELTPQPYRYYKTLDGVKTCIAIYEVNFQLFMGSRCTRERTKISAVSFRRQRLGGWLQGNLIDYMLRDDFKRRNICVGIGQASVRHVLFYRSRIRPPLQRMQGCRHH